MVGAPHDGCWPACHFLSCFREENPSNSHSFSVDRAQAGRPAAGSSRLQQLGRCRQWQRRIAEIQGGVVVGFLGTNKAGHEAPNVSCSSQIRARSPEISWSLGGSRELIRLSVMGNQQWVQAHPFGFSNVKLMPLSAFG